MGLLVGDEMQAAVPNPLMLPVLRQSVLAEPERMKPLQIFQFPGQKGKKLCRIFSKRFQV